MVRTRKSSLKDMSSDFDSGDLDADDYQNLESGSEDHEIDDHHISNQPVDVSSSSEDAEFNEALYEFYKKEKIRSLKRKFRSHKNEQSCKNKRKKSEHETSESVAFTRFSVKYFSEVLKSMSAHHKAIIDKFGFGCLLKFDNCKVPNKFVRWIAQQVDSRSSDIILKDKIISLNKESVHMVLHIPIGGVDLISDSEAGRSFMVSNFHMTAMPQITYFGNMLKNQDDLGDDMIFRCFMIVALSSFLCPNSSLYPSSKYLHALEDVDSVKKYDWSKYVFDWLMNSLAKFNNARKANGKTSNTLGGCIYFLAVYYLDFVNFGHLQVKGSIPRINHWKGGMIKKYSELDQISSHSYAKRPILDISDTCYFQKGSCAHKRSNGTKGAFSVDHIGDNDGENDDIAEFKAKLDICVGSKLPNEVKTGICLLVQKHHINVSVSDSKAENLVLNVLQLLVDASSKSFSQQSDGKHDTKHDFCVDPNPIICEETMNYDALIVDGSIQHVAPDREECVCEKLPSSNVESLKVQSDDFVTQKVDTEGVFLREKKSESSLRDSITNGSSPSQARNSPHDCVQLLQNSPSMPQNHQENCSPVKSSRSNKPPFENIKSFHKHIVSNPKVLPSSPSKITNIQSGPVSIQCSNDKLGHHVCKVDTSVVDMVMNKLTKKVESFSSPQMLIATPGESPSVPRPKDVLLAMKKRMSRFRHVNDRQAEKDDIYGDHPQFNLLNSDEECAYATQWEELTGKALSANNENDFTTFNGSTKIRDKCDEEYEIAVDSLSPLPPVRIKEVDPSCTRETAIVMVTMDDTPYSNVQSTPLKPQTEHVISTPAPYIVAHKTGNNFYSKGSPDVQVIGEKKFGDKCIELCKQTDQIYNDMKNKANQDLKGNSDPIANTPLAKLHSRLSNVQCVNIGSASSSGGKEPLHGPRRVVYPARQISDPFLAQTSKFLVSQDERRYYHILCRLASSKWKGEIAFQLHKTHCNYKSFGESLAPSGHVDNFFMNAYCRHFFDECHPGISKKHYFYSYIGESILDLAGETQLQLVRGAFYGAGLARDLPSSNMLYFPICYEHHWFLFCVNLKDKMFVFLDSYFTEHSDYQINARNILVDTFKELFAMFVDVKYSFDKFRTVYPTVPRQDNKDDCGIFVMKFIELWNPRVWLTEQFSKKDIPNIRIQYANKLYFSRFNRVNKDLVINFYGEGGFPRVGQL